MRYKKKLLTGFFVLCLSMAMLVTSVTAFACTDSNSNSSQAQQKADISGLRTILAHVTNAAPGTAGCSLKSCRAAGELLDWMEANGQLITAKKLKAEVKRWYKNRDKDCYTIADYKDAWKSVKSDMKAIRNKNDKTTGLLVDAGYTLGHSSYSQKNFKKISTAFQSVLYPGK